MGERRAGKRIKDITLELTPGHGALKEDIGEELTVEGGSIGFGITLSKLSPLPPTANRSKTTEGRPRNGPTKDSQTDR